MDNRRKSKTIYVGNVPIGGQAPVSIQSMTNTKTADVVATVKQINALAEAGCQIVRLTVNDQEAAEALPAILKQVRVPLIADIHFDYTMALASIAAGVQGLRLNPGNIGSVARVKKVVQAAKEKGIPIRIGVNGGSLDKFLLQKYGGITADAMVESALQHIALLEKESFYDIKVSMKSSDLSLMLEAYRKLGQLCKYPFHIGVTEAGTLKQGTIKSAVGIGALLAEGLGDTIRVSLPGNPLAEIPVAKEILKSLGLKREGIEYIVCPTCGRTQIDVAGIAALLEQELERLAIKKPLKVAVMGCVVNGPGEARQADIGIAGGKEEALLFVKGQTVAKYPADQIVDILLKKICDIAKEDENESQ